jgi:class 3 adenylate cyclase
MHSVTENLLQVMREAIRIHNGYEINTEGDSFHIAFLDVVEAINFCMEVQYRCLCPLRLAHTA